MGSTTTGYKPSGVALRAARAVQDWAESSECLDGSREAGIIAQAELIDGEVASLLWELHEAVRLLDIADRLTQTICGAEGFRDQIREFVGRNRAR